MTITLKAYCGCKAMLKSDGVISAMEVIRWAEDHALANNHSLIFQGEIRVIKPRKVVVQQRDNQHK